MNTQTSYDWIAFDADDTLWHNERMFRTTEGYFREMLLPYHSAGWIDERLYAAETRNLQHFGYGTKGFMLSMIETAIELTEGRISGAEIGKIMAWGQEMLRSPVDLLEGVQETVQALSQNWRLMLLTKGDLLDQERKLARSGLAPFFSALEVVAHKTPETYRLVLQRHQILPGRFLMIGNSLRSDILPILEIGGSAVYVPYEITWAHEQVSEEEIAGKKFHQLSSIAQVVPWLQEQE